ncbi:MAG: type II toxin-antitoxin system RelE/ParE family toxin [Thermodesulfobacteriota bacterium]
MKLIYTGRARRDIESAFAWYERQRRGLGFEFLDCLEVAVRRIVGFPESCQVVYRNVRRCVIRRFPFSIFFTMEEKEIVVHAVFDNRQDPEKMP